MKDRYFWVKEQIDRLVTEWKKYGSLIVAYDFDNTVFDYHNTGDTFEAVIAQLKTLGHMGCKMICFTSCDESRYPQIRRYLTDNGIPCHGINIDSESVPFKGRKIYYNVFYDDRAGLGQVHDVMTEVINQIRQHVFSLYHQGGYAGEACVYSNKVFKVGDWNFSNDNYPAAYREFRKGEDDIIPCIEDIMELFKRKI